MIRKQEPVLSVEQIKVIDWNVHLGDQVSARGYVERKMPDSFLFVLATVDVQLAWKDANPDKMFDPAVDRGTIYSSDTASVPLVQRTEPPEPAFQSNGRPKYTNIVKIDGFDACKYYFSSANGVNCVRGDLCQFWHGRPEDFAVNSQRWLEQRLAQRKEASRIDGDDHDLHSKVLKGHRGRLFCDWVVESVGEDRLAQGTGVIDVAGGKGDIPLQLWNRRGIPTTLIDPVRWPFCPIYQ